MGAALSCVAKGKCTGLVTACMGSSDCSEGESCCVSLGGGAGGLGGLGGGLGGLGGAGGAGGLGGTGGAGGISIACEKSCTGGAQLCTSNADCAKGVTCQATMFGGMLCGGLAGLLGGAGGAGGAGGLGGLGGLGGFGGFDAGAFGGLGGLGGLGGN
jgi:hypothetical protein